MIITQVTSYHHQKNLFQYVFLVDLMEFDQSMHKDLVIIDHPIQYPKTLFKKYQTENKRRENKDLKEEEVAKAIDAFTHISSKKNKPKFSNTSISKIFFNLSFSSGKWNTIKPGVKDYTLIFVKYIRPVKCQRHLFCYFFFLLSSSPYVNSVTIVIATNQNRTNSIR